MDNVGVACVRKPKLDFIFTNHMSSANIMPMSEDLRHAQLIGHCSIFNSGVTKSE